MATQLTSLNGFAPKPFLKWAGGKGQLLSQLVPLLPRRFYGYHEPFVGSAAMYFDLVCRQMQGEFTDSLTDVRLSDSNAELMNCYKMVKSNVEPLIEILALHSAKHSRKYYYDVRGQEVGRLSDLKRAARFVYLNKTCFNGLYRVNSNGQFNVPMGKYANPKIMNPEELRIASMALKKARIGVADYREVLNHAKAGDLIYFDPPYHPLNATSNFTSYTSDDFGEQQQYELRDVIRELTGKGCMVMLSNSDTSLVWTLYEGFRRLHVEASRVINSNTDKRGKISELVILNYFT